MVWARAMGKAPSQFSRGRCEMVVRCIILHELVPLGVFFGGLWHQFARVCRRQFSFRQAGTGPECDAVQGVVSDR